MKMNNLSNDETSIVYECLKCVVEGKVILHDWEFSTIIGIEVSEFKSIFKQWPKIDETDKNIKMVINNTMINLLSYPHGKEANWSEYMATSLADIETVFQKWHGKSVSL